MSWSCRSSLPLHNKGAVECLLDSGWGRLYATPGAIDLLEQIHVSPATLLIRHANGDWGDLCEDDKSANEQAVADGGRLLSAYTFATQAKVWVIT